MGHLGHFRSFTIPGVKRSNDAINESISNKKLELSEAIEIMANFFYDREHKKKESTIYSFEEMRKLLKEYDSNLKYFFEQLYLAA